MSLVLELQRDALDTSVSVTDLLRKALLVATKLNLRPFHVWVERELKGYMGKKVPEYRQVTGQVRLPRPGGGYIPLLFPNNPEFEEVITLQAVNTPLGVLQDLLLNRPQEAEFELPYPPKLKQIIMRGQRVPLEPILLVPRGAFVAILEAVKDAVLRWSLKLEKRGIIGEGMTFSAKEKEIAAEKAKDLRPPITIISVQEMHNSSIQQNSPGSSQNLSPGEE